MTLLNYPHKVAANYNSPLFPATAIWASRLKRHWNPDSKVEGWTLRFYNVRCFSTSQFASNQRLSFNFLPHRFSRLVSLFFSSQISTGSKHDLYLNKERNSAILSTTTTVTIKKVESQPVIHPTTCWYKAEIRLNAKVVFTVNSKSLRHYPRRSPSFLHDHYSFALFRWLFSLKFIDRYFTINWGKLYRT